MSEFSKDRVFSLAKSSSPMVLLAKSTNTVMSFSEKYILFVTKASKYTSMLVLGSRDTVAKNQNKNIHNFGPSQAEQS